MDSGKSGRRVDSRVRYAIISDIHANLEAFKAALSDIEQQSVDKVICLGDIVGYYADPNDCTDLCREQGIISLRGNHDDAAVGICGTEDFNPFAQKALDWTKGQLTETNKDWLRQLPEYKLVEDLFLAVHGSPYHPYDYIFSLAGAEHAFEFLTSHYPGIALCFFGHTHQRALYSFDCRTTEECLDENLAPEYELCKDRVYLINPGSIGQARDGKPGASYLVYNSDNNSISFKHVPYDFNDTQRKVGEAGLPDILAERLGLGF